MATNHEFDHAKLTATLEAAHRHASSQKALTAGPATTLTAPDHLTLRSECISLTVENNQVCLNLPLGIGSVCLPIPVSFPNGTAAQACLDICTTWGIPTGVRVTVSIAGVTVVSQSFGAC